MGDRSAERAFLRGAVQVDVDPLPSSVQSANSSMRAWSSVIHDDDADFLADPALPGRRAASWRSVHRSASRKASPWARQRRSRNSLITAPTRAVVSSGTCDRNRRHAARCWAAARASAARSPTAPAGHRGPPAIASAGGSYAANGCWSSPIWRRAAGNSPDVDCHLTCDSADDQPGVLAEVAAVDVAGNAARVVGLLTNRCGVAIFHARRGCAGIITMPGAVAAQDQASAARRAGAGELLGGPAAPGDAQNVGLRMTIVVEDRCREPRDTGHSIRAMRQRRLADARDVERDDFALGHPARDRPEQFDVAADPVEQQQRNAVAAPGWRPTRSCCPFTCSISARNGW